MWFAARYGRDPDGIWFAPGRVNLIGGPDYNEVFVLPFALGDGVYAAASRRSDRRIRLASRQAGGDAVPSDGARRVSTSPTLPSAGRMS
jgi:galactokinase